MLYTETPTVHMHTLKVAIIDLEAAHQHYGIEEFRHVIADRLYRLEPFRYSLVDMPMGFHHPMWRENAELDLEYHIRPAHVAAPGGRRQLDDVIGDIASTPLDRTKPLWELYLVLGLQGNRAAVVCKIHHALADGVAAANLMAKGMDLDGGDVGPALQDEPVPSTPQLWRAAMEDHLRQMKRLPSVMGYTLGTRTRVREHNRSLSKDLMWPFTPPATFINHGLDARRRFASASLSLDDVKATAKALEVTINDMVLALSAGGLRRLRLRYDGRADERLLASVPVSFDNSPERLHGNRFSGMLVPLASDLEDPLERVRAGRHAAQKAKENHRLLGPELITRWSDYMPPAPTAAVFRWLSRRDARNKIFTLPVSNVRGPRVRGRVNGFVISEIYSVGPLTAGSGLNITVWSYADQLSISVLADGRTAADPHELTDAMVADFRDIRVAAGLGDALRTPEGVMVP